MQVSLGAGEPLAGQAVVLEVHDGQRLIERLEAVTGSDGIADFADVRAGPGHHLRPLASYDGGEYSAEPRPVAAGEDLLVPLTVWPTTAEGSPVHVDLMHVVVIALEPGLYEVAQVMTVRNLGEAAWLGGPLAPDGRRSGLVVPLPDGALQIDTTPDGGLDPSALVVDAGRLLHLRPVPPGRQQAAVTYELVAGDEGRAVRLSVPYPTQRVILLIGGPAAQAIEVEAPGFTEGAPMQIPQQDPSAPGGTRMSMFSQWSRDAVAPGEAVSFVLAPLSRGLGARTWALLALGLAVALAVGVSVIGGRRPPDLASRRRRLVERAARLDVARENGDLDDRDYFQRRSEVLEELAALEATSPGGSQSPAPSTDATPDPGGGPPGS